jgi:hypothetical protein
MAQTKLQALPVADATWQVWMLEKDESEDDAAAAFVRRHGSHPEHVVDYGGGYLVPTHLICQREDGHAECVAV